MSEYQYTGRMRACGHCGHAPKLNTEQRGPHLWAAWIECRCGITTTKRTADNMRHANSAALHHWNTRDGEQKAAYATHQLKQAALVFVRAWRDGDFELSPAAQIEAVAIEKSLARVYRAVTGQQAA